MFYAMSHMYEFIKFDTDSWFEGKTFEIVGFKNWTDYKTGVVLGTNVQLMVLDDKTAYKLKDGEAFTNRGYRFFIHCVKFDKKVGDVVKPEGLRASLYTPKNNPNCLTVSFSCERLSTVKG